MNVSDDDIKAFIAVADKDGDGMLTEAELKSYFAKHRPGAGLGWAGFVKVSRRGEAHTHTHTHIVD